jgi:hypothetical protein
MVATAVMVQNVLILLVALLISSCSTVGPERELPTARLLAQLPGERKCPFLIRHIDYYLKDPSIFDYGFEPLGSLNSPTGYMIMGCDVPGEAIPH